MCTLLCGRNLKSRQFLAVCLVILLSVSVRVTLAFSQDAPIDTELIRGKFEPGFWHKVQMLEANGTTRKVSVIISLHENLVTRKTLIDSHELRTILIESHGVTDVWVHEWSLPWAVAHVPVPEVTQIAEYDFIVGLGDGEARFELCLDISKQVIRAGVVHQLGYNGSGVKVAIIDSGINDQHRAFLGKEIVFKDIAANRTEVVKESTYEGDHPLIYDNGTDHPETGGEAAMPHGTHCAGIVAGSDPNRTDLWGVAPGVSTLIVAQVIHWVYLDIPEMWDQQIYAEDIVKGITWAVAKGAQVMSMSMAGPYAPPMPDHCDGTCMVCQAADWAVGRGVVVVVAAGNRNTKIGCPGSARKVITVGAMNDKDTTNSSQHSMCNYSGRGPTGDNRTKPDVIAPAGEPGNIYSPRGATGEYHDFGGTSAATPHVAGVAALILQKYPDWTPELVKANIKNTANTSWCLIEYDKNTQGEGLVNATRAVLDPNVTIFDYELEVYVYDHNDTQFWPVENASVKVYGYYSNELKAENYTDTNGHVQFILNESIYDIRTQSITEKVILTENLTITLPPFVVNLTVETRTLLEEEIQNVEVWIEGEPYYSPVTIYVCAGNYTVEVNSTFFRTEGGQVYNYTFHHWENDSTDNPRTVSIQEDQTITAYYLKAPVTLTVKTYQTNLVEIEEVNVWIDGKQYESPVTINATPGNYTVKVESMFIRTEFPDFYVYTFVGWEDDSTDNPRTVAVYDNRTITAYYKKEYGGSVADQDTK